MGSSMTCKQRYCCGNMRDCTGPTRSEPEPKKPRISLSSLAVDYPPHAWEELALAYQESRSWANAVMAWRKAESASAGHARRRRYAAAAEQAAQMLPEAVVLDPAPPREMPKQVDCEFKMKHRLLGGHVHTTIYVREFGQSTWQNTGSICVDDKQYNSLLGALALITNYEEEGF